MFCLSVLCFMSRLSLCPMDYESGLFLGIFLIGCICIIISCINISSAALNGSYENKKRSFKKITQTKKRYTYNMMFIVHCKDIRKFLITFKIYSHLFFLQIKHEYPNDNFHLGMHRLYHILHL